MSKLSLCIFMCSLSVCAFSQLERNQVKLIIDSPQPQHIQFADLDQDGDQDMVGAAPTASGHLHVYLNQNGSGQFSLPTSIGDTSWLGYPTVELSFQLADMDNDGDLDIVSGNIARSTHPFLANDGNAHFQPTGSNYTAYDQLRDFHLTDVDQDGHLDILFINGFGQIFYNRNLGNGTGFELRSIQNLSLPTPVQQLNFLFLDYDQDGDLDLGFFSNTTGPTAQLELRIYERRDDQLVFSYTGTNNILSATGFASYHFDTQAADLDHDGYPEIIISAFVYPAQQDADGFEYQLFVLRSDGEPGNYQLHFSYDGVTNFAIQDINRDSLEDLYVTLDLYQVSTTDTLDYLHGWLANTGPANFTFQGVDDNDAIGNELAAVDIDADNYPELIALASPTGAITAWHNSPQQSFDSIFSLNDVTGSIRHLHPEDWNSDGQTDFYAISRDNLISGTNYELYRIDQQADGYFAAPLKVLSFASGVIQLRFADLNDDELIDLIALKPNTDGSLGWAREVTYWLQLANGDWSDPFSIPMSEEYDSQSFVVGDLDQDGDQDLLLYTNADEFYLFSNELNAGGSFTFELLELDRASAAPLSNLEWWIEDFDLDGRLDLLTLEGSDFYWAPALEQLGTFAPWRLIPPEVSNFLPPAIVQLADFNGDNHTDIFVDQTRNSNAEGIRSITFFDPEHNTFSSFRRVATMRGNGVQTVDIADVNEDGYPDLIDRYGFHLNAGQGELFTAPILPAPAIYSFPDNYNSGGQMITILPDSLPSIVLGQTQVLAFDNNFFDLAMVEGRITWDTTQLCQADSLHPPISNWPIVLTNASGETITAPQGNGQYAFAVSDSLTHTIEVIPPSNYWQVCPPDSTFTIPEQADAYLIDFAADALVDCPLLRINLRQSGVSQCFESTVNLNYENIGTLPAEDASLKLSFDPRLFPINASLPWSSASDTCLTFDLGTVGIGDMGTINVQFEPSCAELILGEVVCFTAAISPAQYCETDELAWDGANLQARVICSPEGPRYEITNTGFGTTAEPVNFTLSTIVNDDIILYLNGTTILEPGESDTITVPNDQDLWYIELSQTEGHPFAFPIALTTDQCTTQQDSTTIALLHQLFSEDGNPFVETICREVVGPYDPNDKTAIPIGLTDQQYIEQDWPIDYTIRFQNIGTDRARNVILEDTISPLLDLRTFVPVGASHNFEWRVDDERLLRVIFPDINLPDSTSNAMESQGFFSYRIKPRSDAPFETEIINYADIFFDYNPAIRTNPTTHRIRKPVRANSEILALCPGDYFNGIPITQDTLIQQRFTFSTYDSIQYFHVHLLQVPESWIEIVLEEPGTWQGIDIQGDTIITQIETAANGCDSLVNYQVDILTRTQQIALTSDLEVFPNPTSGVVQVQWSNPAQQLSTWKLVNTLGQTIKQSTLNQSGNSLQLDFTGLASGTYELVFQFGETEIGKRLQILPQ
ncbi:MAG: T9SS type A sorting domain-containing protein [Bacteroidota bacterium]